VAEENGATMLIMGMRGGLKKQLLLLGKTVGRGGDKGGISRKQKPGESQERRGERGNQRKPETGLVFPTHKNRISGLTLGG